MSELINTMPSRRMFIAGLAASSVLTLPACTSMGGFSLAEAVQRILFLSSDRAFQRMLSGNGFWDEQVAALGLGNFLGTRGDILSRILTSALFKDRLQDAFGKVAFEGAERAAPIVTDAVRMIGIQNAVDLVRGGPTAATSFLRNSMGSRLIEAMVPELGTAMRVASDPLVGQLLSALTGVEVGNVTNRVANAIDDTIWREIGVDEAAIRADPGATRDPLLIGVFGAGARL